MRRLDSQTPNAKRRHTSFLCFPQNVGKREVQLNEVNQDAFSLTTLYMLLASCAICALGPGHRILITEWIH